MSYFNKECVNTYNSDGRISQVEYAMKATNLGTTIIGIKLKDHVILCSEKKIISKLQNSESVRKHSKVYKHIAVGFSGISGDAKPIVRRTIEMALDHKFIFDDKIEVERLVHQLSEISLNFGDKYNYNKIFSRPFGVSLLIGGYDDQPRLYSLDPSGNYEEHYAKAFGSGSEAVEQILEDEYNEDEDLEGACKKSLRILEKVMKDKINPETVEMAIISKDDVKFLSIPEIEVLLH